MNGISKLSSLSLELFMQVETSLFILTTPYATVQVHHKEKSSDPKEKDIWTLDWLCLTW